MDQRLVWSGIKRFRNNENTFDVLVWLHDVPNSQHNNVKKQARQIGFCLDQAEQYFKAARVSEMSTRPVLLYYGLMSFALAEILLKQSGASSLDYARGQNAHHGLDFRIDGDPSRVRQANESCSLLRATPLIRSEGGRFGTFELWHRSARKWPVIGDQKTVSAKGTQRTNSVLMLAEDERIGLLNPNGISFLDCLKCLPELQNGIIRHGIETSLVLASAGQEANVASEWVTNTIIIHPTRRSLLDSISNKFEFSASCGEALDVYEFESGWRIKISYRLDWPQISFRIPQSYQSNTRTFHLVGDNVPVNEFGLYYLTLFMLGSYARYYPDMWMVDLQKSSSLALLAEDLSASALERIPLLSLSELQRSAICLAADPIV
jgi:hypothetical protein